MIIEDDESRSFKYYTLSSAIVVSSVCLILQGVLSVVKPKLSHVDQNILIQLTVARLLTTCLEFVLNTLRVDIYYRTTEENMLVSLFYHLFAVVMLWMFVYAKNLRDQVMSKPVSQQWSLTAVSLLIWCFMIPMGVLNFAFSFAAKYEYLTVYFKVFSAITVLILTLNVLFNCEILYQIISWKLYYTNIIIKFVTSFILVYVIAIGVIMTTYFTVSKTVSFFFLVFNVFLVIPITVMFVIPAGSGKAISKS